MRNTAAACSSELPDRCCRGFFGTKGKSRRKTADRTICASTSLQVKRLSCERSCAHAPSRFFCARGFRLCSRHLLVLVHDVPACRHFHHFRRRLFSGDLPSAVSLPTASARWKQTQKARSAPAWLALSACRPSPPPPNPCVLHARNASLCLAFARRVRHLFLFRETPLFFFSCSLTMSPCVSASQ